jgi:trehalose 2-sulfotransferase
MAERSYLVCATQRSGSTLLCQLLDDTGVAGHPEEYFEAVRDTGVPPHPGDYLEWLPRTGAGIRDDPSPSRAPAYSSLQGLSDYREHLERTFRSGTTANGVFGAKLMSNQLPELHALAGELEEYAGLDLADLLGALFGEPAYVWVSRRDKVRQAVSMWRALQSRRWRSGPGDGTDPDGEPDREAVYRYAGIDHLVRRFEAEDRAWTEFFAAQGISALAVSYEDDLVRDRQGTVATVLAHIGVSMPAGWHAAEPLARQADARTEDWVAAYHRDRAQRRDDGAPDPCSPSASAAAVS